MPLVTREQRGQLNMALPLKRLNVLPNPWCALDKEARPVGVCAVDPDLFGVRYIGARHDRKQTEVLGKAPKGYTDQQWFEANQISRPQRTVFKYATKPVSVSSEHEAGVVVRKKLRTRELLPADEATAKVAKVKWREPVVALAEEKARARAAFDARLGKGAFDELSQARAPVTGAEPEEAPKPKGSAKADKKTAAPRAAPKPDSE